MILGIGTEAGVFLYAGLSGMTVLFAYELLSCLRKLFPHSLGLMGVEDLIFWIGASGYLFSRMYETTFGSIRWFFLLGLVCGAGAGYLLRRLGAKACGRVSSALNRGRRKGNLPGNKEKP
mgnify:CR=1 FL=1